VPICLKFAVQDAALAASRARSSAGISIAARMAMMAITTKSSMSVNLPLRRPIFRTTKLDLNMIRLLAVNER
jgi:hypothetical protein